MGRESRKGRKQNQGFGLVRVALLGVTQTDAELIDVMRQLRSEGGRNGAPCVAFLPEYNNDPRGLHEIPEVKTFCARLWELGLPALLTTSTTAPYLARKVGRPELADEIEAGHAHGLGCFEIWLLANGTGLPAGPSVFPGDVLQRFVDELPALILRAEMTVGT